MLTTQTDPLTISTCKTKSLYGSPAKLLLILLLVIFVAETAVGVLLDNVHTGFLNIHAIVLDAILLISILFPAIYLLVLRPLTIKNRESASAEKALSASEAKYRYLAENVLDVIFELDGYFNFKYLSPSIYKLAGYTPPELLDLNVAQFLPANSLCLATDTKRMAAELHRGNGAASIARSFEVELRCSDGTYKWVEVTATFLFQDSALIRTVGVTRDISARKNADLALNKAYELLDKTISSINEAVFIISTADKKIIQVNAYAEKMFGHTASEMLGASTDILHAGPEMYQRFGEMMSESFQNKGFFETTFLMKRKDGSIFHSEHFVRPLDIVNGVCNSHVSVVRDINERVKNEEELAKACQLLDARTAFVESVLANMQSGILVIDSDFKIKMANIYAASFCNVTPEELIGRHLADICPELYENVIAGSVGDEIMVHFCSNRVTIGFNRFDLPNCWNSSNDVILNFKDLTEIIKIRRELKLRERLAAMGEVVARVAHEMRNPLFGISSSAQILEMELELNPGQNLLMGSLLRESRRLNNLVEELLDSTRELRITREKINLIKIINDSISVIDTMFETKGITLQTKFATDEIIINADFEKLEQVIINLINNAIEASADGKAVDIAAFTTAAEVIMTVTDQGEGISLDSFDKIFDVFFTTKKQGTGMGLSISKNIIEAHGGTLEAANNVAGGATFTIRLPAGT